MYCERCNIEFQEGLRFCKWCGNTLTERRRVTSELHGCPSCAAPIQGNWAFCKACGVKLNAAVSGPVGEFCPRCGSKCDPTWQNCARCGEDMGRGKAHKHTAITSAPGRAVISHCSECGDKVEAGSTHCKGCGTAVYAPSAAFGVSSLLCRVCNSYSPLGSAECRVCGAKFGAMSETADISSGKKSSTLPDLDDHLPGSDYQASETVVINQQQDQGEVISGAHTLIIGPSGAIEAPPNADEILESESSTGTTVIGERPAGGAETTVLPGVAGSKTEQPSPTGEISESRITGPVDEEPVKDTVEEEQIEVVKAEGRNPLSTQLDMPAIRLDDVRTMIQAAEKPPAQPAEPEPMSNATIVMGSISATDFATEEKAAVEEEPTEIYRDAMTAPFGLEPPTDVRDTQPEIPAQQAQDEIPAQSDAPQHQAATTAEFGGKDAAWNAAPPVANPPVEKTVTHRPIVTPETESDRADYVKVSSTTVPPQAQKKGPVVASIVATLIILAVCAFAVWWVISGSTKTEPQITQTEPAEPAPEKPPDPPAPPPTPAPPVAPEGMVYVPGGAYTIGRDDGDAIARPSRSVTLSPFFIDRTEVTNAEYKKFIDATGHRAPSEWKNGSYAEGRDNWPVTDVSWQDAVDYAEWIGKRLPTEAEWEAAARGTDKRIYPWGNDWRTDAANAETKGITEVGQYKAGASPAGALDMIGNVWEWTADEFELYPGSKAPLPPTKKPGITYYVIRGGAFDGDKSNDATRRGFLEPDRGWPKTGFRLVKDAK